MGKDRGYVRRYPSNAGTGVQGRPQYRGKASLSLVGYAQTVSLRVQEQTAPPIGTCLQGEFRSHLAPQRTKTIGKENSLLQKAQRQSLQTGVQVFCRAAQGLGTHQRGDHRHRFLQDKGAECTEEQFQPEQDRSPYRLY